MPLAGNEVGKGLIEGFPVEVSFPKRLPFRDNVDAQRNVAPDFVNRGTRLGEMQRLHATQRPPRREFAVQPSDELRADTAGCEADRKARLSLVVHVFGFRPEAAMA